MSNINGRPTTQSKRQNVMRDGLDAENSFLESSSNTSIVGIHIQKRPSTRGNNILVQQQDSLKSNVRKIWL